MRNCCFPNCTASSTTHPGLSYSYHEIPIDPKVRQKWIDIISDFANLAGKKYKGTNTLALCSQHFLKSDFVPSAKKRMLRPGTVPSIFPRIPIGITHALSSAVPSVASTSKICSEKEVHWESACKDIKTEPNSNAVQLDNSMDNIEVEESTMYSPSNALSLYESTPTCPEKEVNWESAYKDIKTEPNSNAVQLDNSMDMPIEVEESTMYSPSNALPRYASTSTIFTEKEVFWELANKEIKTEPNSNEFQADNLTDKSSKVEESPMHTTRCSKEDSFNWKLAFKVLKTELDQATKRFEAKIRQLNEKLKIKQDKLDTARTQLRNYKGNKLVKSVIEIQSSDHNQKSMILLEQLKLFLSKSPRWSEETIRKSVLWRSTSPLGYKFARKHFLRLPSKTTLVTYERNHRVESAGVGPHQNNCSVVSDEMVVKPQIQVNKNPSTILGEYNQYINAINNKGNKIIPVVTVELSEENSI